MAIAAADWRDDEAYLRLRQGDRRCFAWEWLRRSPGYRAAWASGDPGWERFGLVRPEDPVLDALIARPMWNATVDSRILRAEAHRPVAHLDLVRNLALATIVMEGTCEHILYSDGLRSIRLALDYGPMAEGEDELRWSLAGLANIEPQLLALRQLSALHRHGRFARSLHPLERRSSRWTQMLQVHDARAQGASYREIVAVLFGIDVSGARWRADAAPWRLRAQRLAAGATSAIALGPAPWLTGLPR